MASVLIITAILNIVVSVCVSSDKQPSQFSQNKRLERDDQKDVDRRMDAVPRGDQVRWQQPDFNTQGKRPSKNRKKRQILYLVNQRPAPEALLRMPKTTKNPFIRETNVDEYDIEGPADIEHVPQAGDSGSNIDSHQLVRMAQDIFKLYRLIKANFELNYPIEKIKNEIRPEDSLVRVKRKMSEFRRDRKQITRKKKIGRRKKTKVRRAPVKKLKWYDKHQKVAKKGDGTYRGGRGRIPRQHKRPRHYKPPKNESSVYDYYDDDGKVKVAPGETQEGSDAAEYVEYGTGEYADTAEAEEAQKELEKEYQMQLVRERKRRLMNGTIDSEESTFSHSNETEYEDSYSESRSDGSGYDTEYGGDGTDDDESDETSNDKGSGSEKNGKTPGKQARPKRQLDEETGDVRLIAKRLNVISQSKSPIVQNSMNAKKVEINNKMSAVQFAQPAKYSFQTIHSMTQEHVPDVVYVKKYGINSMGRTEMQSFQSKRSTVDIDTASRGMQLNSIAGDKPEATMLFTSSSKDSRQRIMSIGQEHLRRIQSIAVDPLVLTSEAKYIPGLSKEISSHTKEKKEMMGGKVKGIQRNHILSHENNDQIDFCTRQKSEVKTDLDRLNLKKRRFVRSSPISKQEFSGSYDELSSIPDGIGTSVPSDEVVSANDR